MSLRAKSEQFSFMKALAVSTPFQVVLFSLLTAVSAQITIPVKPVPFTMQTMMVVLSGAFLGAKKGAYSQILYLIMGAAGLPVFAQMSDTVIGFARLFGPTGGYLLAFPIAAYITGIIVEKNKGYIYTALAMLIGDVVIILSGVSYLYAFWIHDFQQAVTAGAVIFSLWTVIKVIAGTTIFTTLTRNK